LFSTIYQEFAAEEVLEDGVNFPDDYRIFLLVEALTFLIAGNPKPQYSFSKLYATF